MPRWSTWKPRAVTGAGHTSLIDALPVDDRGLHLEIRYLREAPRRRGGRVAGHMVSPGTALRPSPFCYCPTWHLATVVLGTVYARAVMASSYSGRSALTMGLVRRLSYWLVPSAALSQAVVKNLPLKDLPAPGCRLPPDCGRILTLLTERAGKWGVCRALGLCRTAEQRRGALMPLTTWGHAVARVAGHPALPAGAPH